MHSILVIMCIHSGLFLGSSMVNSRLERGSLGFLRMKWELSIEALPMLGYSSTTKSQSQAKASLNGWFSDFQISPRGLSVQAGKQNAPTFLVLTKMELAFLFGFCFLLVPSDNTFETQVVSN